MIKSLLVRKSQGSQFIPELRPCSPNDYDGRGSGNFRRAVETALQARQLAVGMRDVSLPVVITAALLHAAGKADD
jgi:hypothetical protein